MTPATSKPPLRNGPCSCGSGKKYKHCCGAAVNAGAAPAGATTTVKRGRDFWLTVIGLAGLVIATIFALVSVNRRPMAAGSQATSLLPGGRVPGAWEFDAANNRHWDPSHNHWHDGPPPAGAGSADAAAASAAAAVGK